MKTRQIPLFVSLTCFTTLVIAQKQFDVSLENSCNYFGGLAADSQVYTFESNQDAEKTVDAILDYTGLIRNFQIAAANVDNAAAITKGAIRYILYNEDFMLRMKDTTKTDWAAYSIMAHEIGHHLQGHTLDGLGSRPEKELEADTYSGYVLGRMGSSLTDAQKVMSLISSETGSQTHPAKSARLAAITSGWNKAKLQLGGATPNVGGSSMPKPGGSTVSPEIDSNRASFQTFVNNWLENQSSNSAYDWASDFAETIDYCYKTSGAADHSYIRTDRNKLINKYPNRSCEIVGGVDYTVAADGRSATMRIKYRYSYSGSKKASGTSNLSLGLIPSGSTWRIRSFHESVAKE